MSARTDVTPLMDLILQSAVSVFNVRFEYIPLEYEQVVLNALIEAYAKGEAAAHKKVTIPSAEDKQPSVDLFPEDEVTPVRWPHSKRKPK